MAAASISKQTDAVAIVVSESSVVRIFVDGEIISELIPELWLLRRFAMSQEDSPGLRRGEALVQDAE